MASRTATAQAPTTFRSRSERPLRGKLIFTFRRRKLTSATYSIVPPAFDDELHDAVCGDRVLQRLLDGGDVIALLGRRLARALVVTGQDAGLGERDRRGAPGVEQASGARASSTAERRGARGPRRPKVRRHRAAVAKVDDRSRRAPRPRRPPR